jgi:hypothetical protein
MLRRQLPAQYQKREPSLRSWTDAGYDIATSKQLIALVSKAFGLPEGEAHKLRPDDRVWSLYRHYYPHRSGWRGWVDSIRPDELEMETLLRDLKRASPSVVVDDLGESVTLGELVDLLQRESRRS